MSEATLRIASLLPSCTEIVCALGLGDRLVARSHECDFPSGVAALPVCTSARLDDGDSRAIDDQVKRLVRDGLSIYDVDAVLLRDLAPTHILTQDQCEVCAASLGDLERALVAWIGNPPNVLSLSPRTLADVWGDIERAGHTLGVEDTARRVLGELTDRVTLLGERVGGRPRPRVACIEWLDPLMAAGNWVPELVWLAGGEPLFASVGAHSAWLDWSTLRDADPDVIVLMPCGFDLRRTCDEARALMALDGFADLRALREGRIAAVDGNAYFNRPGPRLADSAEILAEILHPGIGAGPPSGAAWTPWSTGRR